MDVTTDNVNLLISIANDCYRMGQFYYSLKAFDTLERIDPDPEYWEGKRGSAIGNMSFYMKMCLGLFQMVVAGNETRDHLVEAMAMLRDSNNPQVEFILKVIRKWGKENGIKI